MAIRSGMTEFDYFTAQRAVLESNLTPMDRLVALAILSYWSPQSPEPFPSWTELERRTGLSRSSIGRQLRSLVARKAIVVTTKPPRVGARPTNHYGLDGLLTLADQCHTDTSATQTLVPDRHPTSATQTLVLVPDRHPKKPLIKPGSIHPDSGASEGDDSEERIAGSARQAVASHGTPGPGSPLNDVQSQTRVSPSKSESPKTSKAEGNQKPKAKPAAKAPTDPRVTPTIDAYHQTYQRTVGHAPSGTDYGRAGKQIQRLPPRVTVETLRKAIRLQLEERRGLEYTRGADWVTLPQIVSNLDEILAWTPRKTNGRHQPEPECSAGGFRPA